MIRELCIILWACAFALVSPVVGSFLSETPYQGTADELNQVSHRHAEAFLAAHRVINVLRLPNEAPARYIATNAISLGKKPSTVVVGRMRAWAYDEAKNEWTELDALGKGRNAPYFEAFASDGQGSLWVLDTGYPAYFDGIWHRLERPSVSSSFAMRFSGVKKSSLVLKELVPLRAMFPSKAGRVFFIRDDVLGAFDGEVWSEISTPPSHLEAEYLLLAMPRHGSQPVLTLKERQDQQRKRSFGSSELLNELLRAKPMGILPETYCGLVDRAGRVFLGADRAIFRLDLSTGHWSLYPLPNGLIEAAIGYESRGNRLWFSDLFGNLAVFDKTTYDWAVYNIVNSLPPAARPKPVVLSANEKELVDFTQGSARPKEVVDVIPASLQVHSIYEDRDSRLMLATESGLVVFDQKAKEWSRFTKQNSLLPSNRINCITEDHGGRIWIGTEGGIVVLSQ